MTDYKGNEIKVGDEIGIPARITAITTEHGTEYAYADVAVDRMVGGIPTRFKLLPNHFLVVGVEPTNNELPVEVEEPASLENVNQEKGDI